MDRFTKEFVRAAAIRAVRTGAQVLLSMLAVGMSLTEVNWPNALNVTGMSMLISVLTSLIAGLPETKIDGTISFDEVYYDNGVDSVKPGDTLRLKIREGEKEQ